jgi:hypothetical protein
MSELAMIDAAIAQLQARRRLLTEVRHRGRPRGSGTCSALELSGLVILEATRLWRTAPPTLAQVAFGVCYSPDGLARALRRVGLNWPALRAEAFGRNYGRITSTRQA